MKKLFNKAVFFFILLLFLSNCSSVKEVFTNSRTPNGAEFLVKKKNPLIMPSDLNVLPKPGSLNDKNINNDQNEFDIQSLLKNGSNTETSSTKNINRSLEKSIIEKINKK
jgi:hypothetical protein